MGRSLTAKFDLGRAWIVAISFGLITCIGWLFLGVFWAWRLSSGTLEVQNSLALLLTLGPPIGGILICGFLARPGATSVMRPDTPAEFSTDEIEARVGAIAATLSERISSDVERVEAASKTLHDGQAGLQLAAARAREDLILLSELLTRIDGLSKETTSAVAKRAYALDAAVEGVLRRAVSIFDAIDDRIVSRTVQFESRMRDVSGRLAPGDLESRASLGSAVEPLDLAAKGPVAGLRTLTEIATAGACLLADPSAASHSGDSGECGYPPNWRDCARGIVGEPRSTILNLFDNDRRFRDEAEGFFKIFEQLIADVLSLPSGDATASRILSSDIGRSYIAIAQCAGRLK